MTTGQGAKTYGLVLFLCVVGSLSTAIWLGSYHQAGLQHLLFAPAVLASLGFCVLLTSLNLILRWFRWHFLLRRFSHDLATRDSLTVYLATLPAIVTPFFVGELARVLIFRRKFGGRMAHLFWVWFIERLVDSAVLLTFLLLSLGTSWGLLAPPLLAGLSLVLFRFLLEDKAARNVVGVSAVTLLLTIFAWMLPVLGLSAVVRAFAWPISLGTAAKVFSGGTLFGGVSGLPLGVFVTGSTMIRELVRAAGLSVELSVLAVLVYRSGTAFYAVLVGVASLVFWRRRLASIIRNRPAEHFDAIAAEYEGQIPKHVRDSLLTKKIDLMHAHLGRQNIRPGARGLDLGCGQGWYLAELARRGYSMDGADFSGGQLRKAALQLQESGLPRGALVQADAQRLPFPDGTFDFVYSINVFHHILSRDAQGRALREVVRILRPGGTFILHEMNTRNPLFRWYMGYLFPLLKQIDEGNEQWIMPSALPDVAGGTWLSDVHYFTFLPDFVPGVLQKALRRMESRLESSTIRHYSAHYQACLIKRPAVSEVPHDP
jgi:ubiquinone/menaquinone biosynthesis C-methylase UbiE